MLWSKLASGISHHSPPTHEGGQVEACHYDEGMLSCLGPCTPWRKLHSSSSSSQVHQMSCAKVKGPKERPHASQSLLPHSTSNPGVQTCWVPIIPASWECPTTWTQRGGTAGTHPQIKDIEYHVSQDPHPRPQLLLGLCRHLWPCRS